MHVVQRVVRRSAGLTLACLTILALVSPSQQPAHIDTKLAAAGPWLDRLNVWRGSTGVGPLAENATWSAGDYDHAIYMVKNNLVTHYETPGTPYYTTAGDAAAQASN